MNTLQNIQKLSTAERIIMIEKIWDTVNPNDIKLSEAHKNELDRRLERYKRGDTKFFSWEEVKNQIQSIKG